MGIFGDSPKFEFFRGKNLKNPQSWTYPRPKNFPKTILGIFGDKTQKKLKIEPTLIPEKSPKFFQTLSPSPLCPQNLGMGTGKFGDSPILFTNLKLNGTRAVLTWVQWVQLHQQFFEENTNDSWNFRKLVPTFPKKSLILANKDRLRPQFDSCKANPADHLSFLTNLNIHQ